MVSTDSNSTRSNSFCHWLWASFCGPQFPCQSQGSGHATTLQNMVEVLLVWPGRQMIVGIILLCVNETATYCFEPAHHCHQMQGARLGTSTGAAFQYRSLTHGGCSPTPKSVSLCRPHWLSTVLLSQPPRSGDAGRSHLAKLWQTLLVWTLSKRTAHPAVEDESVGQSTCPVYKRGDLSLNLRPGPAHVQKTPAVEGGDSESRELPAQLIQRKKRDSCSVSGPA